MNELTGQIIEWQVEECAPTGYWLANDEQRLFLPLDNCVENLNTGDVVTALATHDQHKNPVADMRIPATPLNKAVLLIAKDATQRGAFFDWGMTRDLFIPTPLQETSINPGMGYLVHPFVDPKTQRITGATKLRRFYPETSEWLKPQSKVQLTVYAKTDLGYKVLIDDIVLGLLFHSDVAVELKNGQQVAGIIKSIREDGKINVGLQGENKTQRNDLQQLILDDLAAHDGLSTLTDKSSPEDIFAKFGVSKGAYKKAIGHLYKQKLISISKDCIRQS